MEQRLPATRQPIAIVTPTEHAATRAGAERRWGRVWQQRLVVAALVASDVLMAFLIWEVAHLLQGLWGRGPLSAVAVAAFVPTVAVWIGARALLGLYPGYGLDAVEELRRHVYAVAATVATTAVFALAFQFGYLLSRLLLVLGFLGLLFLAPLVRHSVRRALKRAGLWGKPVVVVGSGEARERVTGLLREEWELGYEPTAVFDYRLSLGEPLKDLPEGKAALEEAAGLARERGANTIVFATPHTRREQVAELVGWASANFRHVIVIPNLAGVTNSAVVARDLAGTFGVEIKHNLLDPWALRTKRVLDLAATLAGLLFVLPLLLVLSLLVYLEAGGPVFYKDKRMGRDGGLFSCIKFRTMVPDAEALLARMLKEDAALREEYSKYHKLRDDPRVTRVGRFLRKTSLDELPQLINVLRGEMSLVGPRPYLPRESEEIGAAQAEILRVPPGITGPWQVAGRNHTSFGERVHMDAYYVRDWSVWLDVVLLARTVRCVLFSRGAY